MVTPGDSQPCRGLKASSIHVDIRVCWNPRMPRERGLPWPRPPQESWPQSTPMGAPLSRRSQSSTMARALPSWCCRTCPRTRFEADKMPVPASRLASAFSFRETSRPSPGCNNSNFRGDSCFATPTRWPSLNLSTSRGSASFPLGCGGSTTTALINGCVPTTLPEPTPIR